MTSIIVPKRSLILPRGSHERLSLPRGVRGGLALPRSQRGFMLVNPFRFGGTAPTFRTRLQFPGADASPTFTDDTGKTWTTFGNAQVDTALGDQRGLFDGSGDYATTPNHTDLQLTGDFTIEFTYRLFSKTGFQTLSSRGYTINAFSGFWLFQTGNGDGRINFYHSAGGSVTAIVSDTTTTISTGVDYAVKLTRVGSTVTLSINGTVVATGTSAVSYNVSAELSIGGGSSSGYNNFWFNGWIKDFKIY